MSEPTLTYLARGQEKIEKEIEALRLVLLAALEKMRHA